MNAEAASVPSGTTLPSYEESVQEHYSSKNHSVLWIACCFWLRKGNDNPYRMDYQEYCYSFTILYFLWLPIGSYLSTIGSNLSYRNTFTRRTALLRNLQTLFSWKCARIAILTQAQESGMCNETL